MKKDLEPIIFKAFNSDAFLDIMDILKNSTDAYKNYDIFYFNKDFYIIIHPKITETDKITYILSDFGDIFSNEADFLNQIYEYGKKL